MAEHSWNEVRAEIQTRLRIRRLELGVLNPGLHVARAPPSNPLRLVQIDCEEDKSVRAVHVGMLREAERR